MLRVGGGIAPPAVVPLLVLPVLLVLIVILLIPVSLLQRYRVGTRRQRARGWIIGLNLFGLAASIGIFLASAALTNIWVPSALPYTAAGLGGGAVLGLAGLWLTQWDPTVDGLYFKPNRWLVLTVTLLVTTRILYGFWRMWESWRAGVHGGSWYVTAGVAGAMAAGAVVLAYYFIFWLGVRRRFVRHSARRLRRM
jgi:hypothetical protein